MGKLFRYIIFMFIMTLLTCSKEIVHARNDKTLQVECGEYSSDVLDYIKNNWKSFFGERELEEYEGHDIVFGEPYGVFSVDEGKMIATKFPVYVNEKCVQVLDVFEDNNGKLAWSALLVKIY